MRKTSIFAEKLTLIFFLSIDQKSSDEKVMVEKFYTLNTSKSL
jgi:hypothetical protein